MVFVNLGRHASLITPWEAIVIQCHRLPMCQLLRILSVSLLLRWPTSPQRTSQHCLELLMDTLDPYRRFMLHTHLSVLLLLWQPACKHRDNPHRRALVPFLSWRWIFSKLLDLYLPGVKWGPGFLFVPVPFHIRSVVSYLDPPSLVNKVAADIVKPWTSRPP
jgi:hypothetical protein